MKSIHFLNGQLVEEKDLLISPRDLGYARGYAVFDFTVTYNGHPFKLSEHIERLLKSAEMIGMESPWSNRELIDDVKKTLEANDYPEEKSIKIIISGGVSDTLVPDPKKLTLIILIDPRHKFPESDYQNGVTLLPVEFCRYSPEAKTNNYIEGVKQSIEALKVGAIEPLYYDDKQVYEGATCNIFALIDGQLLTPKSNILGGITRDTLLKILKLNVEVVERDFQMEELLNATEAFITASNKEVMPVVKIGGKLIGEGKLGEVTGEVMRQFREFTDQYSGE